MAASAGPDIVEDGLVLALDGANVKSVRSESTVNLLSSLVNPTFENGTKTNDGWAFDAKTNGSYDYYSLDKFSGNFSVRLKNSTVNPIAFWRNNFLVTSGSKYTVSVYAKNLDCPTTPYFSGTNISLDAGQNAVFTGIDGTWKRFTATYTAITTGNANFYIRTNNNATQGYFLIDNFQIEQNAYPTTFVNSSGWADLSGNGNRGTFVNGPAFDSEKLGSMVFDGVDDYGIVPSDSSINNLSTNFTFEAFLYFTESGGQYGIFTKNGQYTVSWSVYLRTAGSGLQFNILGRNAANDGYSTWCTTPAGGVVTNTWYHLVYTYNGSSLIAYVDGDDKQTTSYSGGFYTGSLNNSSFGYDPTIASPKFFPGKIAVIRLYDHALSAEEIQQNYNATKSRFYDI